MRFEIKKTKLSKKNFVYSDSCVVSDNKFLHNIFWLIWEQRV